MTVMLVRQMAKELAGEFFDQKRSDKFRSKNSTTRAYVLKQLPDGTAVEMPVSVPFFTAYPNSKKFANAHWPHFVDAARNCLTAMLGMPDNVVHPNLKKPIYEALLEDRKREQGHGINLAPNGGSLLQQKAVEHERT